VARTLFVVTEHPDHLSAQRREGYGRVADALRAASGGEVETVHYLDARDLDAGDTVVLSGSKAPWAAHDRAAIETLHEELRTCGRPILGICAGMQLLVEAAGGLVRPMAEAGRPPERGFGGLEVLQAVGLLEGLSPRPIVFHDHEDEVVELPDSFRVLARSMGTQVQAVEARDRRWWGTQFHPERHDASHPDGARVLRNFFALAAQSTA
jgi:GMP synthase (glutamine-hydrolysing)